MSDSDQGIRGELADLYDVFVDWPGRLSREMPGLRGELDAIDARRVLDVGCGTGRHVHALREAGYEAMGADVSGEMLDQAAALTGHGEWFHPWPLGQTPPPSLTEAAPFDAITCLGNVWPQVTPDAEVRAAAEALRMLLHPGGLLLIGLKAVAIRRDQGEPYLPMLRRQYEGRPIYFIRLVDFDVPPLSGGEAVCDFHMIVVRGDADSATSADLHEARRIRIWSPDELRRCFEDAGFTDIAVAGKLGDRSVTPSTEDVFVHARRPVD